MPPGALCARRSALGVPRSWALGTGHWALASRAPVSRCVQTVSRERRPRRRPGRTKGGHDSTPGTRHPGLPCPHSCRPCPEMGSLRRPQPAESGTWCGSRQHRTASRQIGCRRGPGATFGAPRGHRGSIAPKNPGSRRAAAGLPAVPHHHRPHGTAVPPPRRPRALMRHPRPTPGAPTHTNDNAPAPSAGYGGVERMPATRRNGQDRRCARARRYGRTVAQSRSRSRRWGRSLRLAERPPWSSRRSISWPEMRVSARRLIVSFERSAGSSTSEKS